VTDRLPQAAARSAREPIISSSLLLVKGEINMNEHQIYLHISLLKKNNRNPIETITEIQMVSIKIPL